jgi:phage gpG-like protein
MIEVKPVGIKELKANLEAAAARGKDPRPAFRELADDIRDAERQYLGRVRWKPLSPEYAARKARMGKGTKIGSFSGVLLDSLVDPSNRFHVEKITDDSLTVATKNPVAKLFSKGTKRQPPRRLVRLSPKNRRQMLTTLTDYLLEPLR